MFQNYKQFKDKSNFMTILAFNIFDFISSIIAMIKFYLSFICKLDDFFIVYSFNYLFPKICILELE